MKPPSTDHSVRGEAFHVPHETPDSSSSEPALYGTKGFANDAEAAQHNVWDEPATHAVGMTPKEGAHTYAAWYRRGIEATPPWRSWLLVAGLALSGGIFAVAAALFFGTPATRFAVISYVVVAPLCEEMLKIGGTLIVLETRPYLFRHPCQLLCALLASALAFAAIENLMYIYGYVNDPSAAFIRWRWTVCLAMHAAATAIAGIGLMRVLRIAKTNLTKPAVKHAYPYIVTAVCVHGAFNLFIHLLASSGYELFAE